MVQAAIFMVVYFSVTLTSVFGMLNIGLLSFKLSIDSIRKAIICVRIPLSLHLQNHKLRLLKRLK